MRPGDLVRCQGHTDRAISPAVLKSALPAVKALCKKCRSPLVCQGRSLRCIPVSAWRTESSLTIMGTSILNAPLGA